MRNPNGYGSVTYLKDGNRRNRYMVRITTSLDVDENGKLIQNRKVLGYYKTQAEARQALAEYHINPLVFQQNATFQEVYEKWSVEKYETVSASTRRKYVAAFKRSQRLHQMKIRDIQAYTLQQVMDSQEASAETQKTMVQLYSSMFRFAIANQLVANGYNPAEYLVIKGDDQPVNPHHRFSKEDIEKMFRHADDPNVQIVLMLIYSGVRPGELIALEKKDVHLAERWFHIDHGKNVNAARDVPIHPAVLPFFERLMNEPGDALVTRFDGKQYVFDRDRNMFRDHIWVPAMELVGTLNCDGGVHRPHDCRHTFTSLWGGQKLNEVFRRKIQGHSGHGIGEKVYMLPDIEDLRDELDRLWVPDFVGCTLAIVSDSGSQSSAETA